MALLSRLLPAVALALAMTGPALAHTGHGAAFSFSPGFLHPIGGLDHVLAMVAVGLLAAQLGGRALWLVPGTFVTVMALAAAAGVSGMPLPGTEYGILLSIVAISLPVALALGMPVTLAMLLVRLRDLHGHAHGVDSPGEAAPYVAGFASRRR
jgi:urease accessory protein